MDLLGETIGHIRIDELIGEGGMGDVYAGFDEKLQRRVAIKAIRADRLHAETRARLLREARLLSQLDHPNICRIYGYIEGESSDLLVLELIRGKDLGEALDEGLDAALKLEIAEQVARSLAAAHAEGIIHRDLKPANVMLTEGGDGHPGVKVLDFGLARSLAPGPDDWQTGDFAPIEEPAAARLWTEAYDGQRTAAGKGARTRPAGRSALRGALGTASSMSPEQARGEPVTAASDMYSLGLLLQELFTGRPPYEPGLSDKVLLIKASEGDTLPVTGIAPELTTLVERLKSLAPEARPTAAETTERLRWLRRRPRRRLKRLALAVAAAAILLGGLKHTFDLRRERDLALAAQQQAQEAQRTAEQTLAKAEELLEQSLEIRERTLGPKHPEVGLAHYDLANLYRRTGEEDQARHHYRRALEILLAAGYVDEARPIAEKLFEKGWRDPALLELYRQHGLSPDG